MSTETRLTVKVGDVVLAKKRDTGEEYFAFGEQDSNCDWSFDEYPVGDAVTWSRDFQFGKGDYSRPEWFWHDVMLRTFGYSEDCSIDALDEEESQVYIQQAKRILNLLLNYGDFEIIDKEEFQERGYSASSYNDDKPYFLVPKVKQAWFPCKKVCWWWYPLRTNEVENIDLTTAEFIFWALYSLDISTYEKIAEHFEDFAFRSIWFCNACSMKINYSYPLHHTPDGYFYCFRKDYDYEEKDPEWKQHYYDDIDDKVDEFNCIYAGQTYWFCSAKVKDVRNAYLDTLEDMFKRIKSFITKGHSCAEALADAFNNELLSLKEYVQANRDDSCGGYWCDDYTEILEHYLDEQGMDLISIVSPQAKER